MAYITDTLNDRGKYISDGINELCIYEVLATNFGLEVLILTMIIVHSGVQSGYAYFITVISSA